MRVSDLTASLAVLLSLLYNAQGLPCPQLCQSCQTNSCLACYQDWTADSLAAPSTSCGCPQGYYMNTTSRICNFCPVQCTTCLNYTSCTQCLEGYRLASNGSCLSNFTNSTLQFGLDLTNDAIARTNANGFQCVGCAATQSVSNYFSYCSGMAHQPIMGKYAFDFDTVVYRTFYALPYHQWAQIKFQFVAIDQWQDQYFIVQVESGRNQNPTTFTSPVYGQYFLYNQGIRNIDFCGQTQFKDNLGLFNQSLMHNDSILKFRVRTSLSDIPSDQQPPNFDSIYFGIREVLLIIGVCPPNCLTCASKYLCGSCVELYTLNTTNFQCVCDTSVAYLTSKGLCVKFCRTGVQIFVNDLCKPCNEVFPGCVECITINGSYQCGRCSNVRFLYQGSCQTICPSHFYEMFTVVLSSTIIESCATCPSSCLECQRNQYYANFTASTSLQIICLNCKPNYVWYGGSCLTSCPSGTYLNSQGTICLNCPTGCSTCTSGVNCLSCVASPSASAVNYIYLNGVCTLVCSNTNITYYPTLGCSNIVCATNCLTCFGNSSSQCTTCASPYFVQNNNCVSQCTAGFYRQSPVSYNCLPCPSSCKQCSQLSCSSCTLGYWLFSGQCIRVCPYTYYPATKNAQYICTRCDDPYCNLCTELPAALAAIRNNTLSQCEQCKSGFYLDINTAQCVTVLPACPAGSYYSTDVQNCVACPVYCVKCQQTLCLACQSGKVLDNGVCVDSCSSTKISIIDYTVTINNVTTAYMKCVWNDPLCEVYINGSCNECIHINPSLILTPITNSSASSCQFSCPDGYTRSSGIASTCTISCSTNCIQCDPQLVCLKCAPGFLLYSASCVANCPVGYFSDSIQCIKCDANCNKCQQDGKCLECLSGLIVSPSGNCVSPSCTISQVSAGSCVSCASPCSTCTALANICTSCISSYYLVASNSTCTRICPNGQFADSQSASCRPCRPTCKTCTSFQVCTTCWSDYYLFNASSSTAYCISECPPGTFIDVIASPPRCTVCQFPCRSCFGPNQYQCIECVSGYLMDFTTCLQKCPSGKYADVYGHCDKCHYTCKECFGPADFQCSTCHYNEDDEQDGYQYQGRCYSNSCPIATYYRGDESQCKDCSQNCQSCSSDVQCSSCWPGSALFNGSCVNNCPANTYYSQSSRSCVQCVSQFGTSCGQCNSAGCVICTMPYYRYNGSCSSVCPVSTYAADHNLRQCLPCPANCYNCTAPNYCLSCRGNFKMVNNICTRRCIAGYYYRTASKTCQSCLLSNCAGCDNSTGSLVCIYCATGYVLVGQQCIQVVPGGCPSTYFMSPLSQHCQKCHISCLSCSGASTNCSTCATGLRLVNNMCVSNTTPPNCVSNCALCSTSSACTVCSLPYLLVAATGTCTASCPVEYYAYLRECQHCAQGCLSCASTAFDCTSCKSGFYLLGGSCVRDCPTSYYSIGSMCQSCSISLSNCVQCDNSLNCTQCQTGYSLFTLTGKCIPVPKCPLRYFYSIDSSSCLSCPPHCLQCLNQISCLACQAGYSELNSVCISYLCPTGTYIQNTQSIIPSAYLESGTNYVSSRCIQCLPPCSQCIGAQICVNCLQGYSLLNSTCVIDCGLLFYSSNTSTCLLCSSQCLSCRINSTTCTSCRTGFYLSDSLCVSDCPVTTFASNLNNLCQPCGPYCTQCIDTISCQICIDGLWLLNGNCLFQCPVGYAGSLMLVTSGLYNRMAQVCTICNAPCLSCLKTSSQYECTSCLTGFYLYNSRCLSSCPYGYFANPNTLTCTRCPVWCSNCTSYENCQSCVYPGCAQACQLAIPTTCGSCESSCRYCDKSTTVMVSTVRMGTCLQCYPPYHLNSVGRCVLSCASGTYLDSTQNMCLACSIYCSQCSDGLTCQICGNSSYIYNGVCYAACPTGTIAILTNVSGVSVLICSINTCPGSGTSTLQAQSNCTSCVTPYFLYNQQCVSVCPSGTYQSSSANICESCSIECLTCSSYTNCLTCKSDYALNSIIGGWSCVSQCPTGAYLNSTSYPNKCVNCVNAMAGCTICIDNDTCTTCMSGMYLYSNAANSATICVTVCPTGFYSDASNTCRPCLDTGCKKCTLSLGQYKCSQCQTGSYLLPSANACLSACPLVGYFTSGTICIPCPSLCTSCVSTSNCTQCVIGFALDAVSGQCVSSCPVSSFRQTNLISGFDVCTACNSTAGCYDCININACVTCLSNWLLFNGSCLTSCPTGYYTSGSTCVKCNSPCLQCISATNCTSCLSGFNLSSTQTCISVCTSATSYFQSSTQTCELCSSQCYRCTGPRFDQCLSCNVPLLLIASTCVSNCPAGSVASSGICLICDPSCKTCLGSGTAAQCTRCFTGSYLYATVVSPLQGRCVRSCPTGTYADPISSQCLSCSQLTRCAQCDYNVTSQQAQCRVCSNGSISVITNNVLQCQSPSFVCPIDQMYVNSINQCVQCMAPCLRCSQVANLTVCYSCSVGSLWKNGACISSCPSQYATTLLSQVVYNNVTMSNVQTCIQCPLNCIQCTATGNISQCVTCSPQFVLNQGICIQTCGDASLTLSFNQNTLIWECLNTTTTPVTCSSRGQYLLANQSTCIDVCPTGYYTSLSTWACNLCASGCLTCVDAVSCLTCLNGYNKYNNQCVSNCPNQYVPVSGVCSPCLAPCSTCSGLPSKCTTCVANSFLFQQQCMQTCPAGYYSSAITNTCLACLAKCLTCTNGTDCTACVNSQYSTPTCTDSSSICQSNQYLVSGTTCANCSSTCSSCFGPADYQCLRCAGSLVMMDGACLPACISGFYSFTNAVSAQVECAPCNAAIPNCLICSSVLVCVQCISPYLLSPDSTQCVQSCSSLNNATNAYSVSLTNSLQCAPCSSGCTLCVLQSCTSCVFGLVLSNGQCSSNCPTSTYRANNNQCLPCSANCSVCISGIVCVDCNGSNYLFNGVCTSSCPQGYTPTLASFTANSTVYSEYNCSLCSLQVAHCTSCSQTLSVLACYSCWTPYVLVNNTCQCPSGTYYDVGTLSCRSCSSNCLLCTSSQCVQCSAGLYLLNGACVTSCPTPMYANSTLCQYCVTPNCASCRLGTAGEQCLTCSTGYNLLINSNGTRTCVQTCPTGTGVSQQVCQQCLNLHCQTCAVISSCTECQVNYFLASDSSCVSQCPSGTDGVISAGPDVCTLCKTGCSTCTNQTGVCTQCAIGLIPVGDGSCSYNTSNRSCASGQYIAQLNPLVCSACHVSCIQCTGSLNSQCLSCNSPAYSMVNGACISVCTSTQFYNTNTQQCTNCVAPCQTCTNITYCTSCIAGLSYFSGICSPNCQTGYFSVNSVCHPCPQLCSSCQSDIFCNSCTSSATIFYNNICYTSCPTGTYLTATTSGLGSCSECPTMCLSCISASQCLSCASGYYLYGSQCVTVCPTGYYGDTGSNRCTICDANCTACTALLNCITCSSPFTLFNGACLSNCPASYYATSSNGGLVCQSCSTGCLSCTGPSSCQICIAGYMLLPDYSDSSMWCTQACPTGFVQQNISGVISCESSNCTNCANCPLGQCDLCMNSWFLQNSACTQACIVGTYPNASNWQCTTCMDNCLVCPNATYCQQCSDGYNFSLSLDNKCVSEAVFTYGVMANISGFTSNITQITSLVYLSTSAGPVFFGEMSSTYFNIEFCQFMFFHDGIAGSNTEMKTFLQSLSKMSMSSLGSTSNQTTSRRMLLATESLSFLQINVPIFIMMGCFLALYVLTYLIQKYIDSMCLSCSKLNFYVKQICVYLGNRFKWIYFDFVVWLSYLPFLYFSIVQVQKFNFKTGLQGFSSIFSVIVLITYPLYPVLIAYNIKKNYVALCMENDKMVQMSLSPWVYKVKRPQFIPAEGQSFIYCSKANFILMYYPLKYFRKFVFVLVVTVCPNPVVSLGVLLGLNILFIGYMGMLRPRQMPYMIFDFIIEGVMLAFQLFMVVYMILDTVKITAMSITTHAFGFITANLSIIVAIVLNIVAYYKIFMCIYELYQHLKEKVQQKEKLQAKQKDQVMSDNMNHNINEAIPNDNFILDQKQLDKKHRNDDSLTEEQARIDDLGKEQRNIANLLSDKDLIMNNIQPRYDGDIPEGDPNFRGLFDDKELYGDENKNKKSQFKVYEDELPTMKTKKERNDKSDKKSKNKEQKNQKKLTKLQSGLNDTNQYMLKKKEEEYVEFEEGEILQNNRSCDRLQGILPKTKLFSVNEPQAEAIQLRQKSKTFELKGINFQKNQSKNQKLLRDNKITNINYNDSEEDIIKGNSYSGGHNQANALIFNESPDRLINKKANDKQKNDSQKIQKSGKNRIRPSEDMFDEFVQEGQGVLDESNNQRFKNKSNDQQFSNKLYITEKLRTMDQKESGNDGTQRNSSKYDNANTNVATLGLNEKIKRQLSNVKDNYDESENIKLYQRKKNVEMKGNKARESDLNQLSSRQHQSTTKQINNLEPKKAEKTRQKLKEDFFDLQEIQARVGTEKIINGKIDETNQQMQEGLLVSRKPPKQQITQKVRDQNQLNNLQTFTRELKKKQSPSKSIQQQNVPYGNLEQRKQSKKLSNGGGNNKNDYQTDDNYQIRDAEYQTREKALNQQGSKIEDVKLGVLTDRQKKQRSSISKDINNQDHQYQPYELDTTERQNVKNNQKNVQQNREQEGFFSKLFGLNKNEPRVQIQQTDSFNTSSIPTFSRVKRQNHEDFEENNYSARISKETSNKNLLKNKDLAQKVKDHQDFGEDYQEVKRKNKDSIFKGKINYGTINLDESDQKFNESGYSRPLKEGKSIAKKDNGMSLDNKSDVNDGEDFGQGSRTMRAKNKQKTRSKANLRIKDDSVDLGEGEMSSRLKREQNDSVIKRGGKGRLNIDKIGDEEEDLENIQL